MFDSHGMYNLRVSPDIVQLTEWMHSGLGRGYIIQLKYLVHGESTPSGQ